MSIRAKDRFNIPPTESTLQSTCNLWYQMALFAKSLRKRVLQELHTSHFGIVNMKSFARGHC